MEIIISGRHLDISDDLRAYAEERLTRLGQEYAKLTIARLVMEMERSWHLAEVHVTGKSLDLEADARSRDMYTSIDEAVAKIEKQLRRHLDKVQAHHRGLSLADEEIEAAELEEDEAIT